jgi:glycosyltransferase involved in cell wall biosynthesis
MTRPFFSIILPVYNGEKFLVQALESVLAQTEKDWELIIVDDASRDRSSEIMDWYAKSFPNVRVLRNETNLKIARTLNRGVEEAQGKWIARIDADDFYHPEFLKTMRQTIEVHHENPELFFSVWVTVVDDVGQKVMTLELPDAATVERMMPIENFLYHPATCFSKSAWQRVGGYPVDNFEAEDTGMWRKYFKVGMKLVMIPQPLVHYRIHYTNTTSVNDAHLFREKATERELAALRQNREWRISLFLKQARMKEARQEILQLCALQGKISFKNFNYLLFTFLPDSIVDTIMWEIRPRLRLWVKALLGRQARV